MMNNPPVSLRVDPENPNHHLWNNHGTWWLHYTLHLPDFTKRRVRKSLGTRCVKTARAKRDELLTELVVDRSYDKTPACS